MDKKVLSKKKIVLIGALPPPYHGQNISFERLLSSPSLHNQFKPIFIDCSIVRDQKEIGKIALKPIKVFLRSYFVLLKMLTRYKVYGVYLSISQNNKAIIRDIPYLVIVKLFSNAKVIGHLRGSYFVVNYQTSNHLLKKIISRYVKSFNHLFVLGSALKSQFSRWKSNEYIHSTPNGTTVNFTYDEALVNNKLTLKYPLQILYLSTVNKSKGILNLLDALNIIHDEGYDFRLKVAGEMSDYDPDGGYTADQLEKLFYQKLNRLRDKGEYLGVVKGNKKEELLLNSHILALPTFYKYEGLPNAILEGMASSCAIISTDHAAISEVVQHGINGFLVEKKSSESITQSLRMLLNDREKLRAYCKASRRIYEEKYTAEISNQRIVKKFEVILNQYEE